MPRSMLGAKVTEYVQYYQKNPQHFLILIYNNIMQKLHESMDLLHKVSFSDTDELNVISYEGG